MTGMSPLKGETVCPICGKIFFTTGEWVYRQEQKKSKRYVCSYNCSLKGVKADGRRRNRTNN